MVNINVVTQRGNPESAATSQDSSQYFGALCSLSLPQLNVQYGTKGEEVMHPGGAQNIVSACQIPTSYLLTLS